MDALGRRVLITAFDGWNDAGEAASAAVALLREQGAYEPVFSIDPELYFDYQYTRPHVTMDAEGRRSLRWPEATMLRPTATQRGSTELWLLTGVEPARAWQAFAGEFVDVALREDITGMVSLGSMMSDVPHTRPISVFAGSENEKVRAALDLERSSYEGPVGILSVLSEVADAAGIPSASLWASVPHYVAGHTPSPKATLALLDRLEDLTGAQVPRGESGDRGARVGGVDRRRRGRRRGDERVHPPARADPRHVGLARGVRRRDRAGVRTLPPPRRRRPEQARPRRPQTLTGPTDDQVAEMTPVASRIITATPSSTR